MSNLQTLVFYATPEHDCSYLPDKKASTMFVDPKAQINQQMYSQLSQLGFRRSGNHYYRPHCNHCNACIPIRLPVDRFRASRSQKRVLKKNVDTQCQIMAPDFHEDHYLLYEKYIIERHADGDMFPPGRDQYRAFLIDCHANTQFVEFSIDNRLAGIAVIDQLQDGLSAIYTFFDPAFDAFSLGTYAILWQINETRRRNLKYLYLGYFIKHCRKMAYKSAFKPFEARINDQWMNEQQLKLLAKQSL